MAGYYITGVSGTGKSAIVAELKRRGILAYDIDGVSDLCHWRNRETKEKAEYFTGIGKEWLEAHEWICDPEKLEKLLKESNAGVIIAGIASNQKDFLHYFDKVFLLYCDEKTFLNRLATRNKGNQFAKDKSEQEHILSWYQDFQDEMLELGAIPINTEESIENVIQKILLKIRE